MTRTSDPLPPDEGPEHRAGAARLPPSNDTLVPIQLRFVEVDGPRGRLP